MWNIHISLGSWMDRQTFLSVYNSLYTVSQRNLTYTCGSSPTFPAFFNSSSTLQLPGRSDADTVSMSLKFRTWSPSGLLMFTPLMPGGVEVSLVEGKVVVHIYISQGMNTRVDISSGRSAELFFRCSCDTLRSFFFSTQLNFELYIRIKLS